MTIYRAVTNAGISVCAFLMLHTPLDAQKRWDAPAIVTTNCSGCHKIDGNAELPYIPRLAGLDAAYAEKKMAEFKDSPPPATDELYGLIVNALDEKPRVNVTRDEQVNMVGIAHAVTLEQTKQAVQWYAKQCPTPGRGRNNALTEQGKRIFEKGVPDQRILACASCHGQNAQGQGTAPLLAGQNAEYVQAQMEKFRRGDRKHAPEMTMVAKEVTVEQAHAVAAYLQSK